MYSTVPLIMSPIVAARNGMRSNRFSFGVPSSSILVPLAIALATTAKTSREGKVETTTVLSAPKLERSNVIELNAADSVSLTTIKGIGAFYAKNIIKHRNALGGFVSKEQLLEIWKFDQEKLSAIEKYIAIDESKIKKININTCEAADLKSPYIKWTVANAIVNYRKNHGKYKTVDEIKRTDLVDEETYRKIAPYLIVEIEK